MSDESPQTESTPKRVALYARVSTDEQTPALQIDDLEQEVARRGWEIVDRFVDEGVSGRQASRPALDQLLARVHLYDVVMVWRLDRLGRSLQHLIETVDQIRAGDTGFVSLHDPAFDTSATGQLLFAIMGALAEFESRLIAERVTAGMKAAKRRGVKMGRPEKDVDLEAARSLLAREGWTLTRTAAALGVSRTTLRRKLAADGGDDV